MIDEQEYLRRRHEEEEQPKDSSFIIRQVLNICFMILALVGVLYYLLWSKDTGIYIVLVAMVVKFAESALRMMNNKK